VIIETPIIWSLYRIINKLNGKVYIGQAQDYQHRWSDHRLAVRKNRPTQIIHHAMIKYGIENFEFDVIACCKTQDDANYTETELVKQYDSFVRNGHGYNATLGGLNAPKSEEWKQKLREHWADPAYKARVGAAISKTHMGMGHTEATRQKLSIVRSGAGNSNFGKPRTEETKTKIANALIGILHTDERKKKQSLAKIKTTPEQELEIRNKFSAGYNIAQLAREYNFSNTLIRRVLNLKCSKDYRNKTSA
jgi:group I intron endonuclease